MLVYDVFVREIFYKIGNLYVCVFVWVVIVLYDLIWIVEFMDLV